MRRTVEVGIGAAAALMLSAGVGQAASKKSCTEAWNNGSAALKESKLRAARTWMNKCAATSCPAVMSRECATLSTKLALDIPSIVPSIVERKDLLHAVEVSMDGEVLANQIDGRAIDVDPGLHDFVFKSDSGAVVKEKLVIQQGQHNRPVPISFEGVLPEPQEQLAKAPEAAAADETALLSQDVEEAEPTLSLRGTRSRLWKAPTLGTYALAGLGALGVTGYYLFAIWAIGDDRLLARNCSPDCKPESVDHIRRLFLMSRVSLGVGVLAIGGATYLYLKNLWSRPGEVAASRRPPRYSLHLAPTTSGGWAAISGSF
jgi:hypothetical protein